MTRTFWNLTRKSIILACEDSASLMIQTLMTAVGTGANAIDAWGMTPLHHASLSGNSHVVRCLLPYASVDKEVTDKQGRTALHNAATLGDAEVVRLLLSHGANIHAVDKKGLTPLHIAAKEGGLQAVCLLCQEIQKEDIPVAVLSRRDKQNKTPLHYAVENNHVEIARFLLEKGVDPNCSSSTGLTALHLAAMRGGVPMCQLLMDHGAATDVLADGNKTPLFLAATNDRPRIVAFLLDKCVTGQTAAIKFQRTPEAFFSLASFSRFLKFVITELIDKRNTPAGTATPSFLNPRGAGIEDRDVEGNSPLLGAVDSGSVEVVKLLLGRGADIESRNNDDRNVLHMAVLSKNEDVLQKLLLPEEEKLFGEEREDLSSHSPQYRPQSTPAAIGSYGLTSVSPKAEKPRNY
ncbi:hypothetical protein HPB51_015879 [Rhipicephalus microplus]|uniref:Uncharacterized protein n=1 Tax=Rhipicephalus microplus TaxID=6941 RepID=A0A9J6DHQ5_RHIMP|nr:hypothetical protein HPB51_015879 [Rhipicephalus microplus]